MSYKPHAYTMLYEVGKKKHHIFNIELAAEGFIRTGFSFRASKMGNMDGICCFVSVPMSSELRERLSGSKYNLHNAMFFVEDSVGDVDRDTHMASIHYDDMTYAICDQETINNNTVLFVDRETKNTFKCTTQSAALVAVNLALCNVGFEEYQDEADSNQGVVDFPEEYF